MEAQEKQNTYKGHNANFTGERKLPLPSKISEEKVYNYIKKMEIDGLPRIRAYAEAIDPGIYDIAPQIAAKRLDYFRDNRKDFDDIKEMVLAEQRDWSLRRSAALQDKAMNLLSNLIDKANEIATDPEADAKALSQAVSTLRTIMPAFTAMGNKQNAPADTTNRKARAERFIN